MKGSQVWKGLCTSCDWGPAVIETWDYDEHAVLCVPCASKWSHAEAAYLFESEFVRGDERAQKFQETFDAFCLNILRVGTGA
jgi:hypothetical protein